MFRRKYISKIKNETRIHCSLHKQTTLLNTPTSNSLLYLHLFSPKLTLTETLKAKDTSAKKTFQLQINRLLRYRIIWLLRCRC